MKHSTIHQICKRYAIIHCATNEWLFEAPRYSQCVEHLKNVVPAYVDYVIVAVLREGSMGKEGKRQ